MDKISITKHNALLHISQLISPKEYSDQECDRFIKFIRESSKKYKTNFNEHVRFTDYYTRANPSQERLANQADCSDRHTRRFQKDYEEANIFKYIRKKYHRNEIIANPIILHEKVRRELQDEIPAFRKLPISKPLIRSKNVLLINTKKKENNKELLLSNSVIVREVEMLEKIKNELNFGNYEITQLEMFSQNTLEESYKRFLRIKNVKDNFRYLLGICRSVDREFKNKALGIKPKYVRYSNLTVKGGNGESIYKKAEPIEQVILSDEKQKKLSCLFRDLSEMLKNSSIKKQDVMDRYKSQEI